LVLLTIFCWNKKTNKNSVSYKNANNEAVTATLSDSTPRLMGITIEALESFSTSSLTPSLSLPNIKIVLSEYFSSL